LKVIIKLLIAAAIVHASWKVGNAYWRFYSLRDGARDVALFAGTQSSAEIHHRIVEIANKLNLPVDPDRLEVRREPNHTYIKTSYTEKIEVVPSYFYPWEFNLDVDVLTLTQANDAILPRR
jgi:hypothetical protein